MKSVALIHTVKSVANTFEEKLRAGVKEEIKVHNLLDDFLANNPNEIGEFTITNCKRLFNDIKNAELTGADIIVTTCSTLTPVVDRIRPFIKVPVISIDDAMAKEAVNHGKKILVLATAQSTIEPTVNKIQGEADKAGIEVSLDTRVCTPAFQALKALDMELHDKLLLEIAPELKGYHCIVLAQASMSHLEGAISDKCGCIVLSSPRLCIEQVGQLLDKLSNK